MTKIERQQKIEYYLESIRIHTELREKARQENNEEEVQLEQHTLECIAYAFREEIK